MFSDLGTELLKAMRPDYERLRALLSSGADFNEIDPEDGDTVYSTFFENHNDPLFDFVSMGARLSVPEQRGGHPLIYAVWELNFGLLRQLLKDGADPNQLGFTDPGDLSMTALDAVADGFHAEDDPHAHTVLKAMDALLKQYGGHYANKPIASPPL